MKTFSCLALLGALFFGSEPVSAATAVTRNTTVSIVGEQFHINGQPTYPGRTWKGMKIEGLLLNSRMVQGIFDDRNPETAGRWAYPDTRRWDPERNTREFMEAMPRWRKQGLLAFTLNLQGGLPQAKASEQPWHNSAFEPDGTLRLDYAGRLERILDKADELGMAVILGYFYFGQDQRFVDEAAVLRAADNATRWLKDKGYRNVLVEVSNECNVRYDHAILRPERIHELIQRVQSVSGPENRFLVSVSYGGGEIPRENVIRTADFLLLHGNTIDKPPRIIDMVNETRKVTGYIPKPILFNEDDHFGFDQPNNNFLAALSRYASWGYFDPGENNYQDGYQSPPVNWGINTERKRAFFNLVSEITGAPDGYYLRDGTTLIRRLTYHGWPEAAAVSNGKVEVVVVPAIGRIMQFRWAGENDGPFWENRALDGKQPDPRAAEWGNFGGDKVWPAPQDQWPKVAQRAWPPPPAFDSMPVRLRVETNSIVLVSPIDPHYGIRTHRRIQLHPAEPKMIVSTVFEKVEGDPIQVSVWVVTQLKDPVGVFSPVPQPSLFPSGYNKQSETLPLDLRVENGLISLRRDPRQSHKIGMDSGALLWVGEQSVLKIESPRVPEAEYPDQKSSSEIYTNPDPLPYVELELLGPLQTLKPGERMERSIIYTLSRRSEKDPSQEARRQFGLKESDQ